MIFLFYICLHCIGLICFLPLSRRIPVWFISTTGFVWGLSLWFIASLVSLFLKLNYSWLTMAGLIVPIIVVLIYINIKHKTFTSASKNWIPILASLVGISILAYLVTRNNYVYASTDSFVYIFHGRVLAKSGLVPWTIDLFTGLGAFSSVIQMASHLLPGEYLSGYQTILGVTLITTLFISMVKLLQEKFHLGVSLLISGALVLSLGSKMFQNHLFYIHSNLPAGTLLFLAIYSFWNFIRSEHDDWIIPGVISLMGFSFTRIEGPLYSIIILLFIIGVKSFPYRKILLLVLPYSILSLLWHIYLYVGVSQNDLLSQSSILIIIAALAGIIILALISKKITLLLVTFPELIIGFMGFGLLLALLIEPDHMITSITNFWQNLVNIYFWGWTWFIVLAALPFITTNTQNRPENQLLIFTSAGYIFIVLLLSLARIPYRLGETDSANRLMIQILPVIIFAISSNADNLRRWFFPQKNISA